MIMSIADSNKEKLAAIEWILKQDNPQQLKAVSDLIQKIDKDTLEATKIAGYRPKGLAVLTLQLKESILESLKEIENQQYISIDRLEQESDQW